MVKQYIKQSFNKKFDKAKSIVFFDRDGVITKNRDFIVNAKSIPFNNLSIEAIKLLNSHQFPIVIVTNQPIVARGWITLACLKKINKAIVAFLNKNNAYIDAVFSCPHHPQATLSQYRIDCNCRKPGTQMIKDALKHFNIKNGYIIGDQTTDIKAGKDAGLKTFLVKTGYGGKDNKFKVAPDYICKNSLEAARIILKKLNF